MPFFLYFDQNRSKKYNKLKGARAQYMYNIHAQSTYYSAMRSSAAFSEKKTEMTDRY